MQTRPVGMYAVTLPGTTFKAIVNSGSKSMDFEKFLVKLFRTNGGRMTKDKSTGVFVPSEKTKHAFPVTEWLGTVEEYNASLTTTTA